MTTLALSKRGNTQGATHPSEDLRKQAGPRRKYLPKPVHVAPIHAVPTENAVCASELCLG